ncbi:MAG: YeeE/YedE thiosulfate transporter family protein, partial [Acidimicrobiales bacterium]
MSLGDPAGALAGLVAGALVGGVLRRADLCFHSMFRSAWQRDHDLLATWLLAVAIGAVGLTVVYATPIGAGLNRGLAFDPIPNLTGGLLIGVGMVVARSCASGLFYKLGSGMLGAAVGLAG